MTKHQWAIEIEYGDLMCVKCMAVKDSEFAALGCETPAAKAYLKAERERQKARLDDVSVRLAISGHITLEKRLWPTLKAELDAIYRQATKAST